MSRSEDNLKEWILSFHRVGPGDQTQTIRPGDRHLNSKSHLFSLELVIFALACFSGLRQRHLGDGLEVPGLPTEPVHLAGWQFFPEVWTKVECQVQLGSLGAGTDLWDGSG